MARDNYLGYEIDYSKDHDGYRVMMGDEIVHTALSYDAACIWIEEVDNDAQRHAGALPLNQRDGG